MRELRFRRFVWARRSDVMSSGGPSLITASRACAELERELGRNPSSAEQRCLVACERRSRGP